MPESLNSFPACQIASTKKAGFSHQKIADELGLKAKSTVQSVYNSYHRHNSFFSKQFSGRPPKFFKKLVYFSKKHLFKILKPTSEKKGESRRAQRIATFV